MNKFLLSAFADEYSPTLEGQLEGLRLSGISCIEPRFIDGVNIAELPLKEATRVAKMLENSGISVYSVGSPIGKISLDGDHAAHLDMAKRTFENAAVMSAKRVRVFSYYLPDGIAYEDCKSEVLDRLSSLIDVADSYGLTLCHENEAKIYGESPQRCAELLTALGGRMRSVFDMGNFALLGYDALASYRLLREHVDYFHIKDALAAGAIVPPGAGEASVADILAAHAAVLESTVITLEPHLETFSGLGRLVGQSFDNPYKYESPEAAFLDAASRLKRIIDSL